MDGATLMQEQQAGERVWQLRRKRRLTRSEFAKLIGVSEQHVGRIERGAATITVPVLAKICDALGVSADYIIYGSADPMAAASALNGLSREQAQVTLDIAMNVITFLSTKNGNNALLQEVYRRAQSASV